VKRKRIETLTQAEKDAMPAWAQKWIGIGHQTGEANWTEWEKGARACYQYANLDFPSTIIYAPSPMAGAYLTGALSWLHAQGQDVAAAVPSGSLLQCWRDGDDLVLQVFPPAGVYSGVESGVESGVYSGVGSGVRSGVYSGVESGVDSGVESGVESGVDSGVGSGVRSGVDSGVDSGVYSGVDSGVYSGVRSGVPGIRIPMTHVRREWTTYLGGQWWVSWQAYTSFFRDVLHLELEGDLWDRDKAYAQAQTNSGWWWPHRQFVVVSDRPRQLQLEKTGQYDYRMHCETGPAITWADGYQLHFWHGTEVPAALINGEWTTADILREPNAEVRRCAIERMGWDKFITDAGLAQVGVTEADPGNPGNTIALYDVPEQIYEEPVRVLLCTNGTIERDGTRRSFGLTVPASIPTALAAAGWGYGLNPSQYATAQRRT
jgi:uncharacterized protein DUF6745